ncbi:MAG: CPBP family intramembrane glutamic endopeptidase [Candidatus Thorarchaeota archaeon]
MTDDRVMQILRVILFYVIMLEIIIMSPVLTRVFTGDTQALVSTMAFLGTFALMYLTPYAFIRWEGGTSINELGVEVDDDTVPHLIIGLIAGVVAGAVVVVIALLYGGQLRPLAEITDSLIIGEIVITIPVAFFEELAYRGYFMTRMERVLGRGQAIIGSSILFALLHFSWWVLYSVPPLLILLFTLNMTLGGIVLGASYYISGKRLWLPIAFHFAWNMVAYIMFPTFPIESVVMPEIFQVEWGITTIPAFIFGLSLIWMLILQTQKKK